MWNRVLLGTLLIAAGCGQPGTVSPIPSTSESTSTSSDVASETETGSPTPTAPRGRGGLPRGQPTLLDTADAGDRVEDTIDAQTSATAFGMTYRARIVPGFPGLYEFIINNTGSGWVEKFLLQVPRN